METLYKLDKKYFGLAYKDDRDQCYWLPNERLVLGREIDQELNESEHFKAIYHYIKFYPSSFDSINEPSTLLWFFYDLRLRFLRGQLFVSLENFAKCCACLINISSKEDQEGLNIIDIFHTNIIYSSCQVLKVYDIDMADLEQAIIKETENFHNYSQAKLLSIFLSMALNSITYGCYFYDVTDKNTGLKLAINSKGITELDSGLLRTKKVFYWRQLDNLYYRGHIFTIEVRSADSFESEHSMDASMSQANFSKLQTHLVLNKVQHFTYYCESVNLCKAIWSLAIAQHQFFLDEQMSNVSIYKVREIGFEFS
uniref:FERM domain-containing protein n=1 Tax=Acrobeloides nanus TaxID=290746 RepID=A0A914E9P1_9BILA